MSHETDHGSNVYIAMRRDVGRIINSNAIFTVLATESVPIKSDGGRENFTDDTRPFVHHPNLIFSRILYIQMATDVSKCYMSITRASPVFGDRFLKFCARTVTKDIITFSFFNLFRRCRLFAAALRDEFV